MKAIVYEKYGPPEVLHLAEVPKPNPKENELLVKILVATVHRGDIRMRIPDPFFARLVNGLFRPSKIKILGLELAGVVEATGEAVTKYKPGDEVCAFAGFGFGAYAEYKCLPEDGMRARDGWVALKPANLTYEEAAPIPGGGMTAWNVLVKAGIKPGQKVLIYGASGSVGTYAVQLAKNLGAEVTGVCSTANLEMVELLGADQVIDYTQQDFTAGGQDYDIIFDAVSKLAASRARRVLSPNGTYLDVDKDSGRDPKPGEVQSLLELAGAGKLKTVIDRRYTMDQIVEAHHYVQKGHKKGNVILNVIPDL